jgi:hypothetical protein
MWSNVQFQHIGSKYGTAKHGDPLISNTTSKILTLQNPRQWEFRRSCRLLVAFRSQLHIPPLDTNTVHPWRWQPSRTEHRVVLLKHTDVIHRPDVRGSTHLWNVVGLLRRDYTVPHPRRPSDSYSPLGEPEISRNSSLHPHCSQWN